MPGLCRVKDVGSLTPEFVANGTFKLEVVPPDGVLEELIIQNTGAHTTNITTVQTDGEVNIYNSFRVTAPRRGLPPIIHDVLPRDLKYINMKLAGQLPTSANPTATTAAHEGNFLIPYVLPARLGGNPLEWGLDTSELSGPIIIEGVYAGVASIGVGSTAITNATRVSACVRRRRQIAPSMVLSMNQNRIAHESAARQGPDTISVGNIQALFGIFLRQHDNSATAAQRVDGLVTRFIIDHSDEDILSDDLFNILKRRSNEFFGIANANVPAGIGFPVFATDGQLNSMPVMEGGRTLKIISDSAEAVPDIITDVTPASGDAYYAVPIGVQLTALAQQRVGARGLVPTNVRR